MNLGLKDVGKLTCICISRHFSKELKLDASEYGRVQSSLQYQLLLFVELQRSCLHRKKCQVQANTGLKP